MVSSSSPSLSLLLFLLPPLILLFLHYPSHTLAYSNRGDPSKGLRYNKGPILKGHLKLGILWYGRFGAKQKVTIRQFIRSLNNSTRTIPSPSVARWWRRVEEYQSATASRTRRRFKKIRKITVRLVRSRIDAGYSLGKILTQDFFPPLVEKATGGDKSMIAVIFAARDVSIDGTCMGECSRHGALEPGKGLYIVVGNPVNECPAACAWPFHNGLGSSHGAPPLKPPSGNIGTDAMVISFASALAHTVTNPYNSGFSGGTALHPLEAVSVCPMMFGSGAKNGYPGKVQMERGTGRSFNAYGANGRKFLLPAIWSPKTRSCRTMM